MRSYRADFVVQAKDLPETRLVVEVKREFHSPDDLDRSVRHLSRYMWGANCHFGLIVTRSLTYVLRDDFTRAGAEAIDVTDTFPTHALFGVPLPESTTEAELEQLTRRWLQRLTTSYESALPDDPAIVRALFPEIVGAVSEGRIGGEVLIR